MLYLGADHRGFALKESLKRHLSAGGVPFEDYGDERPEPEDDYVDYGLAVARAVAADPLKHRGVLICGSGIGMAVVANKVKGVRAALVMGIHQAVASRTDDDANVLVLEADETTGERAAEIIDRWLTAPFSGAERHQRRLEKIKALEAESFR
jgi:ribose 5-phosphate isomerase B